MVLRSVVIVLVCFERVCTAVNVMDCLAGRSNLFYYLELRTLKLRIPYPASATRLGGRLAVGVYPPNGCIALNTSAEGLCKPQVCTRVGRGVYGRWTNWSWIR